MQTINLTNLDNTALSYTNLFLPSIFISVMQIYLDNLLHYCNRLCWCCERYPEIRHLTIFINYYWFSFRYRGVLERIVWIKRCLKFRKNVNNVGHHDLCEMYYCCVGYRVSFNIRWLSRPSLLFGVFYYSFSCLHCSAYVVFRRKEASVFEKECSLSRFTSSLARTFPRRRRTVVEAGRVL
jgi:hypothetical protein